MITNSFSRAIVATVAVLGLVGMGVASPANAQSVTGSAFATADEPTITLSQHGGWRTVAEPPDRCSVRVGAEDGSELKLEYISGGGFYLVVLDPNWDIAARHLYFDAEIDGVSFSGTAVAAGDRVVLPVSDGFLDYFVHGYSLWTDFGIDHWRASLIGSLQAMDEMVQCIVAVRG